MVVIADSSCLIALLNIGRLEILHQVYGQLVTTPTVATEVNRPLPDWIQVLEVKDEAHHRELRKRLDPGEASALALALEIANSLLVLDDLPARKVAAELNLPLTGTLGVLKKAKEKGIIPRLKPIINELKSVDFRLSKTIEQRVLLEAGEL